MARLETATVTPMVQGFRTAGVRCGLKTERPDIGLIVSDGPDTTAAAVFTRNACAAAPVHVSRQNVQDGDVRAVVVNAGNANACTGRQGLRDALEMVRLAADETGLPPEQVLVCSTGIIGHPLDMDAVRAGIPRAAAHLDDGGEGFANAILTTDSGPKTVHETFAVGDHTYNVVAISKGAGMVHPDMATMLSFVLTDAPVPVDGLRSGLRQAVDASFNQISIDGCESTNDAVIVLANGAAGGPPLEGDAAAAFQECLTKVCRRAAQQIVADGEGATRTLHMTVEGAPTEADARRVARAVVSSDLVKAALHGSDPNWGRIVSAAGSAWRDGDPARWSLDVRSPRGMAGLLRAGEPLDPAPAADVLRASSIHMTLHLGGGDASGEAWGCDLTPDYVTFNSKYTT